MSEPSDDLLTGTVVRAAAAIYEVDIPSRPAAEPLQCSMRGKLKHGKRVMAQPVSVGDRVQVKLLPTIGEDARGRRVAEGYIEKVLPRTSQLGRARYRKASQITVANLDQVVVVMSLREPELNLHRIDRFLVLAEAADLRAIICLNKCDLLKKRELALEAEPIVKLYNALGYPTTIVSAETNAGIKSVRGLLQGHISALIGSSGVGKSSLVNAVQPGLRLWVGDVMDIGKGRHTTTDVSLHRLKDGGYIADTPGVKTIALLEQQEVNLPHCFPEFAEYLLLCRFNDCTHDHEPGCAVREAVNAGKIANSRYDSYRKMLEDSSLVTAHRKR